MKVADLSIEELKALIKEAVEEEFRELLGDPDKGLHMHPEMQQRLQDSLASTERIPFDAVKKRLNLR